MKEVLLKDVYKEINAGKMEGYIDTFTGRLKISGVDWKNWIVITGQDLSQRSWYVTPDTIIFINNNKGK